MHWFQKYGQQLKFKINIKEVTFVDAVYII